MGFEIDHIFSLKHGGSSEPENLAYTCLFCNQNKGSDIGTILLPDDDFQRFYNPRKHKWKNHFEIKDSLILSKTSIGEGTIKILQINSVDRLVERRLWIDAGAFPHPDVKYLFQ